MTVSVVIPTYQRQQATERAVRSVIDQAFDEIEIIVVDDHSPTPFVLPAALVGQPIRIIRLDRNRGAGAARNAGIAAARGDWIALLDSDDQWRPGKLMRQLTFAAADSPASPTCYACGFTLIEAATGARRDLIPIDSASADDFAAACWFAPGSTLLFHRSKLAALGSIDEGLGRIEDLDWFLRFGLAGGQVRVAPFVGADIDVGRSSDATRTVRAVEAMQAKWLGRSPSKLTPRQRRLLSARLHLEQASAEIHAGQRVRGGLSLLRSLIAQPRLSLHGRQWWTPPPI